MISIISSSITPARLLVSAIEIMEKLNVGFHISATSETSVSFVTNKEQNDKTIKLLTSELENLGAVTCETDKTLICVVGEELKKHTDALSKIFTVLSSNNIKARLVAQSASEINVAFIVENNEVNKTIRFLHGALSL